MTALALVLAAALAVACVIFVALPFLREPQAADDELEPRGDDTVRRLELVDERDRALAALRELEFDHRTGKVADEEYRAAVRPLRRAAAAAIAAVEAEGPARLKTSPNGQKTPMTSSFRPTSTSPGEEPQPAIIPEPMPPPDEGAPPQPAIVPEPFPPPDEGDRPQQPNIPEPSPRPSDPASL